MDLTESREYRVASSEDARHGQEIDSCRSRNPVSPRYESRPRADQGRRWWAAVLMVALLSFGGVAAAAPLVVGHEITVTLDPARGTLQATDALTLPPGQTDWDILLHAGLDPRVTSDNASLETLGRGGYLERLRLRVTGEGPVVLSYGGTIRHDLASASEGMGRARETTPGTISAEGVFLGGGSGWYPLVPDSLQRFSLTVNLPDGWQAVSQGAGPGAPEGPATWSEGQPQDDIYLIAAPFTLYRQDTAHGEAQVWLREPDPGLAETYLQATARYLDLYSRLIGDYPYAKFALVENFWETGYGMPSFTLLGPRVIRLPFILYTSYPHEVLHNWWGNGVFVDFESGNWSEGLTAYLADHLMKELQGEGSDYRRDLLKSYADYVRGDADFPLVEFRARHGSASQAIGYGKAAMVFHMLRRDLGDDRFQRGLQGFYRDNRFQVAGWGDLQRSFEGVSNRPLGDYFTAWTSRPGAPRLGLTDVRVQQHGAGYRVSGRVDQTQLEPAFPMSVPMVIHQERGDPVTVMVPMRERSGRFETELPSFPVRLAVDPGFDTFRDLMPGESPVALSNLFGSDEGLIVLPAQADDGLRQGYAALAEAWTRGRPGWKVQDDRRLRDLPSDRPVWILGWENRHLERVAESLHGASLDPGGRTLSIGETPVADPGASLALTASRAGQPLAWLAAGEADAIPGLARKLPHYGKYGYLLFTGTAPDNRLKGQWPSGDSELVHWFSDARPMLEGPVERPLITP